MNRHLARTLAMQTIFESDFQTARPINELLEDNLKATDHSHDDTTFLRHLVQGVTAHRDDIDEHIIAAAPEWPIEQISGVDKSILRLAVFELLYDLDIPAKVAINESVELAKTFGGDNTSKFVNGVLGTIYRKSERYQQEEANGSTG